MVLDPVAWTVRGSGAYGTSSYGWVYLHQGGRYTRFDDLSGLYYFRMRDYSPTLGRWMEQDPVRYRAGDNNLYGFENGRPTNRLDPTGLLVDPASVTVEIALAVVVVTVTAAPIVAYEGYQFGTWLEATYDPWTQLADWWYGNPKPVDIIDIAPRRPRRNPRQRKCDEALKADDQTCRETYCDNPEELVQCYKRAMDRYARCLAGDPPRPPLIPR